MAREPDGNPFSTCYVRPGRLAFVCGAEVDLLRLTQRLAETDWRGQIVGPHGAGKSSLLHAWVPQLARRGRTVVWWTLPGGQRHLPQGWRNAAAHWTPETLVVVDGYEQLSWWTRRRLACVCRRTGAGLLVTTHRDAGLPMLIELNCPLETVQQLVAELTRAFPARIASADVAACYASCRGNVRDLFFALYDLYELRRPA